MSDPQTKHKLERLRVCFPSDAVLAEQLSCELGTLRKITSGQRGVWDDTDIGHAVESLYEQVQNEDAAGIDAVLYTIQTLEWLESKVLTEGQKEQYGQKLDNLRRVLQKKAEMCNA